MLANFHMGGIMLVLRAIFNMLVRNASPRGPMCFRCLMFNLSGPCELLFLLVFRELCPVSFLVVGESPAVLLLSVVMSSCRMLIVVMMGKWSDDIVC